MRARPASFDSATALTAAVGRFLDSKDFPVLGRPYGSALRPALVALNQLPEVARRLTYTIGSGREGLPADVVSSADTEQLASEVVKAIPARTYPGALIGSTPGSAVHVAAALGMPLLPQTVLLPLARRLEDPDAIAREIEEVRSTGERLVERNPDVVLHHMADPVHDRRTLTRFSYFRLKRMALGRVYERFLIDHVPPGGTLYLIESEHRWPTHKVADRYVFQLGGVGGVAPEEYLQGSDRVDEFLTAEGSRHRRWWEAAPPDGESPEAEWGFEPALARDVTRFARRHGFRVVRLRFSRADRLSPLVAELYRWWYRALGRQADRLFVESFVLVDPYWVLRAGVVPFWITFNGEPDLQRLGDYLDDTDLYERIEATLVSNGTWTIDLAAPERWEATFARARRGGGLAGVDAKRFPTDLAVFARYADTLRRTRPRLPLPPPMRPEDFESFAISNGPHHGVSVEPV